MHGDKEAVDALLTHPDVAAVSFVGSTPIARHVYETGTAHGKRVQALGGAKNHMVVLPDADVDLAADAAVSRGVRRGRRAVHGRLGGRRGGRRRPTRSWTPSRAAAQAAAGRRRRPDTDMGPLITAEHRDKVAGYIEQGAASGAAVVVDGRSADVPSDGFFLGTTLLDQSPRT